MASTEAEAPCLPGCVTSEIEIRESMWKVFGPSGRECRQLCDAMDDTLTPMVVPGPHNSLRLIGGVPTCLILFVCVPDVCFAAQTVPGEARTGFLFTLTHLHPVIYLILGIIFVLSVINFIAQGWISGSKSPFLVLFDLWGRIRGGTAGITVLRGLKNRKLDQARKQRSAIEKSYRYGREPIEDSVVSVHKLSQAAVQNVRAAIPTPMDGLNHSLPEFSTQVPGGTGAPRIVESRTESKPPTAEFKFTSAVDLPSPQEVERREKNQLAVSGCVRDPEGRGIGSVIVYLMDETGNRLGQSCRSAPDTGEFRVLANESGKYMLGGYKRGYVMESMESLPLPIEVGKIEQFNFVMRAEGCEIRGKVLRAPEGEAAVDFEVRCDCRRDDFSRSSRTNEVGEFQIPGVPPNSECTLALLMPDGTIISRSEPFQTVQKKEIYREIRISPTDLPKAEDPAAPVETDSEPKNGTDAVAPPQNSVPQASVSHD